MTAPPSRDEFIQAAAKVFDWAPDFAGDVYDSAERIRPETVANVFKRLEKILEGREDGQD